MPEFLFDQPTRVATILLPDTEATVQEIYNAFRHHESSAQSLGEQEHVFAGGKFDYGTGDLTVVSMRLLDGWKVAFAARPGPDWVECAITGGNLASVDALGAAQKPVHGTPFVTVQYAQATTGALIEATELADIWTRLFGGRLYVDPATAKELIYDAADVLYSEALIYSDDGTTPYDGEDGIARRDRHVKL